MKSTNPSNTILGSLCSLSAAILRKEAASSKLALLLIFSSFLSAPHGGNESKWTKADELESSNILTSHYISRSSPYPFDTGFVYSLEVMVDYSKWSKFSAELSDSDDDLPLPKVTRLDDNARVTSGQQGLTVVPTTAPLKTRSSPSSTQADEYYVSNGKSGSFEWRQSKHEVFLRVKVDHHTRASDVTIQREPLSRSLSVVCNGELLVQGILKYDAVVDDDLVDWELINDCSERYISLVLKKKSPIERTVLWWSCVFEGDSEIDVTAITERKLIAQDFKEAWNEAHRMFREKVAGASRVEVHLPQPEDENPP